MAADEYEKLVDLLSDPDVKKRDYDAALDLISKRVDVIWKYILKASNRKLDWWAFRNDLSYGHGNGSTGGHFDPVEDKDFIELTGEFTDIPNDKHGFYEYDTGFQTELLWAENYELIVQEHLADCLKKNAKKEEEKAKKASAKKLSKQALIENVKSKLTAEELKIVTFK